MYHRIIHAKTRTIFYYCALHHTSHEFDHVDLEFVDTTTIHFFIGFFNPKIPKLIGVYMITLSIWTN